ncbi:MAG: hypothetical protein HOO91_17960 [Bacteroidales bacterium]|nr:hypothetical protein [Bacteroidales bacterium]
MNNNLNHTIESLPNMELFTSKLKKEDEYNLKISKTFFRIYIGFIGFYFIIIIVNLFFDRGLIQVLSQILFILSFVAFVLIFRDNLKIFKKIDYSLPLAEMLNAVVKRYHLKIGYLLILLIPIVLMDGGLTLSFYEDLESLSPLNRVLIVQAFYIPVMAISTLIGILIWRHKQKPLRDKALELLKELEN